MAAPYDKLVPAEFQPKALSARYVKALQKAWGRGGAKVKVLKSQSTMPKGWDWGNYTLLECFPPDGSGPVRAAVTINVADTECSGVVAMDSPYGTLPLRRTSTPEQLEKEVVSTIADHLEAYMVKKRTASLVDRVVSRFSAPA